MLDVQMYVVNNAEEILAQNEYNELSQLKTKKVGGKIPGSGLQWIDYKYNIRGWMTQINDPTDLGTDLFGYKINYNQVEGLSMPHSDFPLLLVKPKYNGNIAEISWKTLTEENEPLKRYGYVYDNLNRLNAGFYQKAGAENAQEYYERLEYDLNGNITRLQRSEGLLVGSNTAMRIDNLKYDYMGNKLTKVNEEQVGNSNGYPYLASHNTIEYDNNLSDGNGNMTKHLDKGINSIEYNYLNLPSTITRGTGRKINVSSYLYRADGTKLKKIMSGITVFSSSETDYLDGFQYDNKNGFAAQAPVLKFIPTSEGYFDFEKNQYIYNYVDHLGNVRIGYSDSNGDNFIQPRDLSVQHCEDLGDGNIACYSDWVPGEVVEVNNYYPFGLLHNYTATTTNSYQYKYNGKELQETGMYDYGARFYMPDIGRWGVGDPLAEKNRRFTPYNYAINNPIRFIDPDGRSESDWIRKDGKWQYDANVTTVEQAQQMRDVDGFAKNGTVMSNVSVDGGTESAYAQFNEGGSITKLGSDDLASMSAPVDALPMSLGGSWTTWTTENMQSFTGGTNETDPSTASKALPGDTFESNNMFEYILNGFNRSRTPKGEDGLYQFGIDIQSLNPFKQTQDSVHYPTWTPDSKGLVKDTMPGIPMGKDFDSKAFLRLIERTDSARTEKSRKFR